LSVEATQALEIQAFTAIYTQYRIRYKPPFTLGIRLAYKKIVVITVKM